MMQARVPLPDGMVLGVTEWSAESQRNSGEGTIVFLHGLGDSAMVWLGAAPTLAERYRVLAVDLRGHGDSDWASDRAYSVGAYTADIEALFDQLRLDTISLVGHSLGAAVALRYAARYPEKVDSMIIVDHGPDVVGTSAEHIREVLREAHRVYAQVDDYAMLLIERHPLGDRDLLKRVAGAMLRTLPASGFMPKYDPAVVGDGHDPLADAGASDTDKETWKVLGRLRSRTAILRGMASSVLSAAIARRMVEVIGANASLETIPMAGHAIHLDNPIELQRAIVRFFT